MYVCKTATTPLVFHLLSVLVQCCAPILAPSGERTGDGWTKWAGLMEIHTSSPRNTQTSFLSWIFKSPSSLVQSLLTLFPQQSHRPPPPILSSLPYNQRTSAWASIHSLPRTHAAELCPTPCPSFHLASLLVVPPFWDWISSAPCLDLGHSGISGTQKTTDIASCLVVLRPRRKGLPLIQPGLPPPIPITHRNFVAHYCPILAETAEDSILQLLPRPTLCH